jgi:hypothetical protein
MYIKFRVTDDSTQQYESAVANGEDRTGRGEKRNTGKVPAAA